jgi:CRP-like cAMP-binding protein
LAYEAQEIVVPRGGVLVRRGEPSSAMYLLVDGTVASREGRVGPGDTVGFLEALAYAPAPEEAVAETPVVAFRVETDALREVCEQNFAVLSALLGYVAERAQNHRPALLESIATGARSLTIDGPLDRVARIVALHRSPAVPSRNMDALAELAGHLEEVRVDEGDRLWSAGDEADGFYLVCSGGVLLEGGSWGAGEQLGPGSVPGMVSMLAGRPHHYDAVGAAPSVLLRAHTEAFLDVIEDHFEMAFGILGRLARILLESGSAAPGPPITE